MSIQKTHSCAIIQCLKGINQHFGPHHPGLVTVEARLRTFNNWTYPATPQELAEAGLFSIDHDDFVKCFHCEGGLCNWQTGDVATIEHIRHYPECEFMAHLKQWKKEPRAESPKCVICLEQEVEVLYLPCKHMVCCASCTLCLKRCPTCRTVIRGAVKPFLP